jgi:hypothetical protein
MKMCSPPKWVDCSWDITYVPGWDIRVAANAVAYLCDDAKLLSMGGIILVPGSDTAGNFRTKRETYFYNEELVGDYRFSPDKSLGYIVLRLPKNDVAKYFVVSVQNGKVEFRNG